MESDNKCKILIEFQMINESLGEFDNYLYNNLKVDEIKQNVIQSQSSKEESKKIINIIFDKKEETLDNSFSDTMIFEETELPLFIFEDKFGNYIIPKDDNHAIQIKEQIKLENKPLSKKQKDNIENILLMPYRHWEFKSKNAIIK